MLDMFCVVIAVLFGIAAILSAFLDVLPTKEELPVADAAQRAAAAKLRRRMRIAYWLAIVGAVIIFWAVAVVASGHAAG